MEQINHQIAHNYYVKYEKYLPFNRYDDLKIEIGVLHTNL